MTGRRELLYLSALAAHVSPACVGGIVRHARRRNAARGISSVLVFDGWRFCQYLAGGAADVAAVTRSIAADSRHAEFTLVHAGRLVGASLAGQQPLIFALCYDASLDDIAQAHGAGAVDALARLLPQLDASPGDALLKRVSGF